MPNTVVERDHPPLPLAPVDPSVKIPDSVKRAAARAESYYSKTPPAPLADPATPPAEPAPPAPDAAKPPVELVAPVEPETRPQPVSTDAETRPQPETAPPTKPDHEEVTEESWHHRFLSMQGRFNAATRTIGSMQQQMQELGDELMRTQQIAQRAAEPPSVPPVTPKFITPEDEAAYGPELIDLATRAARQAIAPEIDTLKNENRDLKQRVITQARQDMFAALDAGMANWRDVNRDPRFISWLRLPDVYSRRIRQSMLNEAYQAADAPTVMAFFKGFLRDETATGHADPAPQPEPQPAPRQAAVPLETLAAPGRARPATGATPGPADKPIFTRAQIQRFYADVRRGVYNGREADKARDENAIFAAQREGRVRG